MAISFFMVLFLWGCAFLDRDNATAYSMEFIGAGNRRSPDMAGGPGKAAYFVVSRTRVSGLGTARSAGTFGPGPFFFAPDALEKRGLTKGQANYNESFRKNGVYYR